MGEPDDTCNPAAPPSDWEVLSMSASSHTPSSAKTGDDLALKSVFRYPVLDYTRNPYASGDYFSALDSFSGTNPLHAGAAGSETPGGIVRGQNSQTSHLHESGPVCKEPDAETLRQTDAFVAPSQKVETNAADSLVGLSCSTPVGVDRARRKTYGHSAEVMWTIAVAATVVGIFFLGRRLRAELFQNQQLQLELSIKDEKLDNLTHQVASLKDVLNRHHTPRSSMF